MYSVVCTVTIHTYLFILYQAYSKDGQEGKWKDYSAGDRRDRETSKHI